MNHAGVHRGVAAATCAVAAAAKLGRCRRDGVDGLLRRRPFWRSCKFSFITHGGRTCCRQHVHFPRGRGAVVLSVWWPSPNVKVRRLNAIATRVQPEHMLTCAVPSSTFVFIFFSPLFSVGVGTLYCAIRTVAQANQGNTVRRAARGPRHKRARVSGAHYEQRAVQQGKPSS